MDIAYSRWKRYKTPDLYEEFSSARKRANKCIKSAKTDFYATSFSSAVDSKSKWKTISDLGIGKHKDIGPSSGDADELNKMFINITATKADPTFYSDTYEPSDAVFGVGNFEFRCVAYEEVLSSFKEVKSNAIDPDGVDPKFIRIILPRLLPYISYFFNTILTTSTYPNLWKHVKIIPVPKTNMEYRPIAILCLTFFNVNRC
ncbi:uncharacterized protein [Musca autumnalis]|uniref:uncharacterized protein n=1 Tax=Musca autumnalis TaxID=221902 RepID=UPI003CF4E60D